MNVGLLGHGVVGSGVAEILLDNADIISANANTELHLKRILDLREFDLPYRELFVKEAGEVTQARDIDIVVECMGGVEPAYTFLKAALESGKHCVTSNKQLVVEKGEELIDLALKNNVHFLYEASCGGGIPVLSPIQNCLGANHILSVLGILNGTTNYILTSMMKNGVGYRDALAKAQELGYAEKDPSADVEGHDARRKIAILAHHAFGSKFSDEVRYPCTGISGISYDDLLYAKRLGYSVRLLGGAFRMGDGYTASVWPYMLPAAHPLSSVQDVNNAVYIKADKVNEVMFYGPGAGKLPTASAAVSDIIEAASKPVRNTKPVESLRFVDGGAQILQYFVRVTSGNVDRAMQDISKIAAGTEYIRLEGKKNEFALITPKGTCGDLNSMIERIQKRKLTLGQVMRYVPEENRP